MIRKIEKLIRGLRKRLARSDLAVRMLGLPCVGDGSTEPGLIMIQIDGFSHQQLIRALEKGRMPFLKSLIDGQDYKLKPFYSGIPSSTPAVQAELFFGVQVSIPGFEYYQRKDGRHMVLFDTAVVNLLADRFKKEGEPLLTGGAAYADIYTAGAKEARFCMETFNIESFLRQAKPIRMGLILLSHSGKILRIIGLSLVEFGLAVYDFVLGIYNRRDFFRELKFVPTRIGVSIVFRELVRMHVKMDIARGIRIVHANFLGYDEHAHRRSPSSLFAHWTLKGIDGAIRDIYHSARRSECRDYHVVIHSDHGQEDADPYGSLHGKEVQTAVAEVFSKGVLAEVPFHPSAEELTKEYLYRRGRTHIRKKGLHPDEIQLGSDAIEKIKVAHMGPLGHIYLPVSTTHEEREHLAKRLVKETFIPQVFFISGERILVANPDGVFDLDKDRKRIIGENHPFLDAVTEDMERVCRHPDAGTMVISGWLPGKKTVTFATENGSHGGPGMDETKAFVILPPSLQKNAAFLRPSELRERIFDFFKNHPRTRRIFPIEPEKGKSPEKEIRVMTYNIHSCVNMDGRIFPERIARVIDGLNPDIVALQEVDNGQDRTRFTDQARIIAEYLDMEHIFLPLVVGSDNGKNHGYGIAVLSRFPLEAVKMDRLPGMAPKEPRGIIWVKVQTPAGPVHLFNTHLSLYQKERKLQIQAITGEEWIKAVGENEPVIFCGDLNAGPKSPVYKELSSCLQDAQIVTPSPRTPQPTFFSRNPIFRIDHIFISDHFNAVDLQVPRTDDAKTASDHLPLMVKLTMKS